jgi:hypothetical protein
MKEDAALSETRKFRDAFAARFDYDLEAICRDIREKEMLHRERLVTRAPKRIVLLPGGKK